MKFHGFFIVDNRNRNLVKWSGSDVIINFAKLNIVLLESVAMESIRSKIALIIFLLLLSSLSNVIFAQSITIRYYTSQEMNSKDRMYASPIYVSQDVYLNGKLALKKGSAIDSQIKFTPRRSCGEPAKIDIYLKSVKDVFGNRLDLSKYYPHQSYVGKDRSTWIVPVVLGTLFVTWPLFFIKGGHVSVPAGVTGTVSYTYDNVTYLKYFYSYPSVPTTFYSEHTAKDTIDEQNDGIVGIYEAVNNKGYKLACLKVNGEYCLIFLSSDDREVNAVWKTGEVKAVLHSTSESLTFNADWYMAKKLKRTDCNISFIGNKMKTRLDGKVHTYLKLYPASPANHSNEWSGTGFALNSGYVVTNHHVIDGAKIIEIYGVKGDFETPYTASVIASDKNNDLALLKINDSRFTGFGTIPYKVKTTQSEVGESISVLGYPLTSTMGEEIKLTTGVISSKTGFQGDVSLYQISAAIQPGSSGGPLFDNYGNIIGIISSKHTGAENVGYAVKATYLRTLIESCTSSSVLPTNNSLSGLTLPEKVKRSKNFIFMIKCK